MTDPIDGVYVLVAALALAALTLGWLYAEWHQRISYRRRERLVERNLFRISGGRRL